MLMTHNIKVMILLISKDLISQMILKIELSHFKNKQFLILILSSSSHIEANQLVAALFPKILTPKNRQPLT
jgi:hypothetical protein